MTTTVDTKIVGPNRASRLGSNGRPKSPTSSSNSRILDGTGTVVVDTGVPFFDHMLTLGSHASFDLTVTARGDVEIEGHHDRDTAIVLGPHWAGIRRQEGDSADSAIPSSRWTSWRTPPSTCPAPAFRAPGEKPEFMVDFTIAGFRACRTTVINRRI